MKKNEIILFKADTNACRIGATEMELRSGEADFVTAFGPFEEQDFRCKSIDGVLRVTPKNGKSYQRTLPPGNGPTEGGLLDHVKFIAYSFNLPAPQKGDLAVTWKANVEQLNITPHPYGSAVKNPNADLRLAAAALNSLDPSTNLVFDFILTNEVVYAIIERLPGLEAEYGNYLSFSFAYPVYCSKELRDEFHTYRLSYNREKGQMTWFIDGDEVLRYNAFGQMPNRNNLRVCGGELPPKNLCKYVLALHGGEEPEEPIEIVILQAGFGLFTLLDWGGQQGLVRLESSASRGDGPYYVQACTGEPQTFKIDCELDEETDMYNACIPPQKRIYGQGSIINLKKFYYSIVPDDIHTC